ncbi:hypothetical protein HPB49_011161 [Dermacentor silvarum]|uniref:Uncharacterized protein n=1 Tax=Dermacentor silvarum TaxID=543639 RepID=A0ACB8C911_DERSI|nr:hypothetical protein HPB49_011161 [Dermacentor silvarum]
MVTEYVVFGILMAFNLGLGVYFSRRRIEHSGTAEVFLGSRSLRSLPLAVSMVATMLSSTGLVGFTGHFYAYGFHQAWNDVAIIVVAPLVAHLFLPVLYELRITSVFQAAHLTATDFEAFKLTIRNNQNLDVARTPHEELANCIRRLTSLKLGGKDHQVSSYVAAPDMSCKGVVTGIDTETNSDELTPNLRSPKVSILYARMLRKSTDVLITFDELEVPRTLCYYGGELRCLPLPTALSGMQHLSLNAT